MSNKIFQTILNRKIDGFASTFIEDSESIFFEEGKLIHPGEYGRYRENSLAELINAITNHKISEGFIITPENNQSTQIDIVVYNKEETPLLETGNVKFHTIESVLAIGEVKSTMSKSSFSQTLRKLAKNKKLNDEKNGVLSFQFSEDRDEHNELVSFLVCKKMDFDYRKIDFDELYEGIERKYWHNFILSLDDGFLGYEFKMSNLKDEDRSLFEISEGNLASTIWYEYPVFSFNSNLYDALPVFHEIKSKFSHIEIFAVNLAAVLKYKSLYTTDFINYMDMPIAPVFNK